MEEFITNAALLAGHLTQQCEKAAAAQEASSAQLQRAAAEVGQGVAAGRAELAQSARAAVREALSQEIPAAVEAIGDSGDRLAALAEQLSREQAAMAGRLRMLTWKALAALVAGSAAIVGGTAYFAWSNVQRAQQAKVEAQVLEALQQVSITSCDGHPCIKLEDGLQRWQKNDEYVLVDARARPPAHGK
ncbi:hypothetical protein A9K58_10530 [Stenotrophomonas maltophilia]|uniref:Relaxation protein n=1 Tax=Stenotrophomonas maltophilia TaxID=40324 RepID=A0A1A6XV96_STEMA|nr:hypothetical protein [Stenotrophomonas maltophilia]OBU66883.1 hypothetical protein A9K58_10530 [Stenotrophomonas maltophilia]